VSDQSPPGYVAAAAAGMAQRENDLHFLLSFASELTWLAGHTGSFYSLHCAWQSIWQRQNRCHSHCS